MKATRNRSTVPIAIRLQAKLVATENGCLEFEGSRNRKGYGQIQSGRRGGGALLAHRAAWEAVNGPIPDGLFVCHKCDNPPCCNVDHLFLGTNVDNMRDMKEKGRQPRAGMTECKRGHEYTPENTVINSTTGSRQCRACRIEVKRRYNQRQREKRAA